ncbi:MAG TPA: class II aldolase/adducin family protein [Thermoanaerobaculia bacterium]
MSADHDRIRFDLCCAARLLYRNGLSAANAGHISVSIGGDRMLVNHFGPSFATLRPSNVVVVDFSGKVIEGNAYVNDTIRLHGIIHRENPQATVVLHTHPPAVVTYSAFRKVPEVFDQESCLLVDDIAVIDENYEGLASDEERVMPIARALRQKPIAILPNHGAITTADSIPLAAVRMLLLEGMVQRNLSVTQAARATGLQPIPIAPEAARRAKSEIARIPVIGPLWQDFLERLQKTDPDLFAARSS